tara:strand:- start:216 stop:536 length:321 start_codon:yes stop_codon:yes gene_type:complete
MYNLTFLKKENDLNKIIKNYRKENSSLSILFISLWDDYCSATVDKLVSKYESSNSGEKLYVVDSYNMPHSFVIYKTTKLPHLVQLREKHSISEDYLPNILKKLRLS